MRWFTLATLSFWLITSPGAVAQPADADFGALLGQLQSLAEVGDSPGFLALLTADADVEAARAFAGDAFREGVSQAVVRARFSFRSKTFPKATATSSPSRCSPSAATEVGFKPGS